MARTKKLPTAAAIVAIFNLVLFIPCLCCSGGGAFMNITGADGSGFVADPKMKADIQEQQAELEREAPNLKTFGIVSNVANLLLSLGMITAAIGLLMKQSWGRLLGLVSAALLILLTIGTAVVQVTTVVPATVKMQERQFEKMRQQNPNAAAAQPPRAFLQGAGYLGVAFSVLIGAGYPLLAIALLMTGSVRNFFAGSRAAYDEDFDDDDSRRRDDDDSRRRDDDDDRRMDDDSDRDDRYR